MAQSGEQQLHRAPILLGSLIWLYLWRLFLADRSPVGARPTVLHNHSTQLSVAINTTRLVWIAQKIGNNCRFIIYFSLRVICRWWWGILWTRPGRYHKLFLPPSSNAVRFEGRGSRCTRKLTHKTHVSRCVLHYLGLR